MPQEIQRDLFDANASTTRKGTRDETGTGFGMPIVKSFLDHFEASIEVSSVEGGENSGTLFTVQFKIHNASLRSKVSKTDEFNSAA